MQYNKLVRDKIPGIILKNGKNPSVHIAEEKEFREKLFEKLKEETDEYCREPSKEELADILEVIDAICEHESFSLEEIEAIREKKRAERGGFSKRLILDNIE
jgi:predicted house-cleaning noncanonical NTP pyrophosphatase (MazG superfamily)